jgi:hypothetical protein
MAIEINETWQAALKERGDKAFELFCDVAGMEFISNEELVGWGDVQLKKLDKLIKLDIERYGKENYLWMYEWNFSTDTGMIIHYRKLYANWPFNIGWAKAGVPIEVQMIHSKEWVIKTKGLSGYFIDSMRHPFPPLNELGL